MWLHDALPQVMAMLDIRRNSNNPVGVSTGIDSLDDNLGGGWLRQQTSYIVGESGVGKSWLTSWWILQATKSLLKEENRPISGYMNENTTEQKEVVKDKEGKPPVVVYWSLEMSESLVCYRLITQLANIFFGIDLDSKYLLSGNMSDTYYRVIQDTLDKAKDEYNNLFLEFDLRTIDEFDELLFELSLTHDICYVVVDYFRLIDVLSSSISEAQSMRSSGLRRLAQMYDCHVQAIFDITREGEKADKISASHMKGGTAARYDADMVLSISEDEGKEGNRVQLNLNTLKTRLVPSFNMSISLDRASGVVKPYGRKKVDRVDI